MWSHWESDKEIQKTCLSYQRGQAECYVGAGDLNSLRHTYTADTSPPEPFPWPSFKFYCHSEGIELQFIILSYEFLFVAQIHLPHLCAYFRTRTPYCIEEKHIVLFLVQNISDPRI